MAERARGSVGWGLGFVVAGGWGLAFPFIFRLASLALPPRFQLGDMYGKYIGRIYRENLCRESLGPNCPAPLSPPEPLEINKGMPVRGSRARRNFLWNLSREDRAPPK